MSAVVGKGAALAVALVLLGGRESTDAPPLPPAPATTTTTTTGPPPAPADPDVPATVVTPGEDTPNPFVLHEGSTYHLYASQQGWLSNVQARSGPSLRELGPVHDAMPVLPAWVRPGFTWAPDVRRIGERYVLWFTAGVGVGAGRPMECIGVATSASPDGPFVAVGSGPAICQRERRGSIDPRTFRDGDGQLWLHWKSDDNAETEGTSPTTIYARRLAPDGQTLVGPATPILHADQPWEGRIVEAPQLVRVDGRYWLFYSGNWFNQPAYGIGVAECDGPAGPCRKPLGRPWLGTNAQGAGPGESSLFHDGRGWWIVYGPWAVDFDTPTPRPVALARVVFGAVRPYLGTD